LTQLHDDLDALLLAELAALGDVKSISAAIDSQIVARVNPALGAPDKRPIAVLVIWVDPVPVDLFGGKNQVSYNPQTNSYVSTFSSGFVSVAGNVEMVVLPFTPTGVQNYVLGVSPTPEARGGVDYFGTAGDQALSLTSALRGGQTQFLLSFGSSASVEPQEPSSPSVDAPASQLTNARLLDITSTFSANTLVTLITPLSTPSDPVAPAGGAPAGEASAAAAATPSSVGPGTLGQAAQTAPPSFPSQTAAPAGSGTQAANLAAHVQLLIDRLKKAADLLRGLLPALRVWLQSLLGAWGAGAAAAVQPPPRPPAAVQPAPRSAVVGQLSLPLPGVAAAVPEAPPASLSTDAAILLGEDYGNGGARLEVALEQTDPAALVGLLAVLLPRGHERRSRAERKRQRYAAYECVADAAH
jgi:hypothetical protein